ncbi:conserved hypothetical protein [Candidatus Zixiibacteriota bacterium]|nr:conserved hypothetical protein [candidate division Zixibacteria bacterium]
MKGERIRWLIFAGLFILAVISYIFPIQFESRPSPEVKRSFNYIENLPDSSVVMISFDHEASSLPEIQPISLAILQHVFRRNLRVIGLSLFAEGTAIGYEMLNREARQFGKQYGKDYVFLGFKPQHISAILGMGESIVRVFPEDYFGNKTDTLPVMQGVDDYGQVALVISIADGDRAVQWIEYAGARYNQKIMAGLTAAMITTYDPYLASGQLYSDVGGLKGAAEYERLLGHLGAGNRGMWSQTVTHMFVIAMIILGNIVYFRSQRARRGRG